MDNVDVQSSTTRAMVYLTVVFRYVDVGSIIKTRGCSRRSGSALLVHASVSSFAETASLWTFLQAFPVVHGVGVIHHLLFIASVPQSPVLVT